MSETKAAFAERAIQSLKHLIYRYIEDHDEKFVPKLQQLVSTLNCRKSRSIEKSPRDVKNIFLSILYNKSFQKDTKPKLKIGDRIRNSENEIPFRKGCKPQFTDDEIFEISAISTKKTPTYIIKDLEKEEILGKFYRKELKKRSD